MKWKNAREVRGRMAVLATESKGILEQHPDFDFSEDDESKLKQNEAELKELQAALATFKQREDLAKSFSDYSEYLNAPAGGPTFPQGDVVEGKAGAQGAARSGSDAQSKAISQLVLTDEKYQAWFKSIAPHGHFAEKVQISSPQVNIPGGIKALVTGADDTSAGAFIQPDRLAPLFLLRRPLTMRDIITIGRTESDMVEYVRQVSETNNAAMVPEAQSTAPIGDGTGGTVTAAVGGLKPESGMVFEKVTTPVRTVAHWMPATKRALADAGQMQTLIDNFLRFGIEEELEDQMVLGNNTGENFNGLTNISGLTAQAYDTNLMVTTRKAKTKVRTVGRMTATAYLLNPYDWENIQLLRTEEGGANTGQFFFGGPAAQEVPTLWNLPVVESESVPQGTGYVGNFKTLVLWDREQTGVQMTDSHADFFVRNLVAILAEARAAFGCLRPSAIVEMDLTA
jgi:HK97 family phage major capsid protein